MPEAPNKKDFLDRLMALATILIPASVALAGYFIAQGLKQAEISSEEMRAERSHAIAEANTRIAQANIISTLMSSLTSSNQYERQIAAHAMLIALPERGLFLVRAVAKYDEDEVVKTAAKTSLGRRANELIRDLFSEDAPVRIAAYQDLIQDWGNDSSVVLTLVEFANRNLENENGVYNTVVVLSAFSKPALEAYKPKVVKFLKLAKDIGSKTEAKANALARRLGE